MQGKRFRKNDEGFVCSNCGNTVYPLFYTSRDHCPKCLYSIHVDVFPGDRENDCKGKLRPVAAAPDAKKGFIITYKCEKCQKILRNKAAEDDDMNLLIALTVNNGG